jgi:hypothetical protein
MKRALRFMVAKYTPDLHRMEPKNVGLVLWSESGTTLARFIGERQDVPVAVPTIIEKTDRHAYREWLTYWRHQLAAEGIKRRSGAFVPRSSPEFLEALREKSKEKFRLVDGGMFTEKIAERDMEEVLDEMYDRIVERPESQLFRAEKLELYDACKRLFESSGIARRDDLQHDLPVPRKVHGVLRTFTADFALGPINRPTAVLQRVLLTRAQSIDSNALMFDALLNDKDQPIDGKNCAALVNLNQPLDSSAKEGIKMLKAIVPLIDVSKADSLHAMEAIRQRAGGPI